MVRLIKIFVILLSNCILALPVLCTAQKVKLINSTATGWSGGIAGRYGTSNLFEIEFSHCGKEIPEPDTLWIGNKCIVMVNKTVPGVAFTFTRTIKKGKVTVSAYGGTSYLDDKKPQLESTESKKVAGILKPSPPFKYGGVALLSYKFKGEQKYFEIDRIITQGKPVNYP